MSVQQHDPVTVGYAVCGHGTGGDLEQIATGRFREAGESTAPHHIPEGCLRRQNATGVRARCFRVVAAGRRHHPSPRARDMRAMHSLPAKVLGLALARRGPWLPELVFEGVFDLGPCLFGIALELVGAPLGTQAGITGGAAKNLLGGALCPFELMGDLLTDTHCFSPIFVARSYFRYPRAGD